jgi:hypothetical protein
MKSETEIRKRLTEIENDERLSYPPATIQVNAPLALIQTQLETASTYLRWVLEDDA